MRAGYRILARNWRGGGGELDLVALDRDVLVFVEVRARTTVRHGRPSETVGFVKQRRVVRAAVAYRAQVRSPRALGGIRFDVVEVVVDEEGHATEVEILRAAFDASVLVTRGGTPLL